MIRYLLNPALRVVYRQERGAELPSNDRQAQADLDQWSYELIKVMPVKPQGVRYEMQDLINAIELFRQKQKLIASLEKHMPLVGLTWPTPRHQKNELLRIASDGEVIDLGALQVTPFTVPHDAREPLQMTCTDGSAKLGVLTDLGHATAHVLSHLAASDALLLECNHDTDLLMASSYPAFLKRRVGGLHGHLSNINAAEIARALNHGGLKYLVAAHLSVQNNRPAAVQALLAEALAWSANDVVVATPHDGCPWLEI